MRIAIVGAGVSGLVAAWLLHAEHEIVVVYEAGSHAGGHTNIVRVQTAHGDRHVDTGFIVTSFHRLWELYLSYCEGGFAERRIQDVQLLLAKPGYRAEPLTAGARACLPAAGAL
jgi:glycine/D-amino acid oxidase-like deaminating enzyme